MPKSIWTKEKNDRLMNSYYQKSITAVMQEFRCTESAVVNQVYRLRKQHGTLPDKNKIKHLPLVYLRIDARTVVSCKPEKVRKVKLLFGIA